MTDHQIQSTDNRTLSFADYGKASDVAVLCCHGGPGSRMEAKRSGDAASAAGFRLIGIDRPGYGGTTVLPGRSICDWTRDALAIADHLGLEKFFVQGNSTGGSYALATASVAPERVLGVLVCCGMSDMNWAIKVEEAKMEGALPIWDAPDRDGAIAIAVEQFGEKGEKMLSPDPDAPPVFSPPDMAVIMDPAFAANDPDNEPFAQGAVGYADDRIADGPANGWSSFDVSKVVCPVLVIHGEQDWIVPIAHARHTASILTDAELRTFPEHGHMSIGAESVAALVDLKSRAGA
ncbi:MAG: alpha/beta hydrolase [bacterium]